MRVRGEWIGLFWTSISLTFDLSVSVWKHRTSSHSSTPSSPSLSSQHQLITSIEMASKTMKTVGFALYGVTTCKYHFSEIVLVWPIFSIFQWFLDFFSKQTFELREMHVPGLREQSCKSPSPPPFDHTRIALAQMDQFLVERASDWNLETKILCNLFSVRNGGGNNRWPSSISSSLIVGLSSRLLKRGFFRDVKFHFWNACTNFPLSRWDFCLINTVVKGKHSSWIIEKIQNNLNGSILRWLRGQATNQLD